MYFVFFLQVYFVLISSSPLYDFNCCPNSYPGYGNDQPFVVQGSNYNPYVLDLLVQNRLNPLVNSQSVPHQYQYLNTNNLVPNYQLYNQNGLDMLLQHVPETETEKVINNYILIPEEYLHNNANEYEKYKKTGAGISNKNKKNKSKRRRLFMNAKINNGNADISNQETKKTSSKGLTDESESAKNRRKKTKKKNSTNNSKHLKPEIEETLPIKKVKSNEEAIMKNKNNHLTSSQGKDLIDKNKPSNKPKHEEPKIAKSSLQERKEVNKKEPKKVVVDDFIPDVKVKSRKKADTGFADVNVCFDISEDCTDLICRHTRNKELNKKNKPQSLKPQPDLPNNFNNYMNGLTFNQQINPNVFNPNVNFPFNFDYLYQMPQTSNVNPKDSNNRRKSRKRKQPSSNRQINSNKKNKNSVTTMDSCDKIVELNPEFLKVETTSLVTTTTKTKAHTEEPQPELKNDRQEETALETDEDPNLDIPTRMYTETLFTENLHKDEISNNNNVPFGNYNDVMDEYYPDFTLDNTYMTSKEDYDFGNFHNRHYYTYADTPELNRERRKYEHPNDNKLNGHRKFSIRNQNKNIMQEPSQIQEILCKTDASQEKVNFVISPALQFPGFKTKMINKEKYFAEEEHGSNSFDTNGISTHKICPSVRHGEGKQNKNYDNVEMVFANSKVVKYGAPEKKEVIAKVPEPEVKKEFKNLMSPDGKTTLVIAQSLGYS